MNTSSTLAEFLSQEAIEFDPDQVKKVNLLYDYSGKLKGIEFYDQSGQLLKQAGKLKVEKYSTPYLKQEVVLQYKERIVGIESTLVDDKYSTATYIAMLSA